MRGTFAEGTNCEGSRKAGTVTFRNMGSSGRLCLWLLMLSPSWSFFVVGAVIEGNAALHDHFT